MKAAVIHAVGTIPTYEDFADPKPASADEVVMTVKASSLKQLDKSKVSGKHYTTFEQLPTAVGVDGTGILADGTRVYARGITGMMAEQALVDAQGWVKIPDGLDMAVAAALPNALLGSDAALLYRGQLQQGQTVLINGATGVSGRMAVQMARFRGAGRVIATGRNPEGLEQLKALGADEVIGLRDTDGLADAIARVHSQTPIDIVIDYLWGKPMELILEGLKKCPPRRVKIVTVGEMAGPTIDLPSGLLRSSGIELLGSGIGSISGKEIGGYLRNELPVLFALAAQGKITIGIETAPLADVAAAWGREPAAGKRIVITM